MATDWNIVRATALDCLDATWTMIRWAARSQEDDYDTEMAALHLAAIDAALNTFRRALEILQPGLECGTSDLRHSPVFDAFALASVGEGPRPDFKLCATAHEKAFQLLRMAILGVENGLNDELDRRGAPDSQLLGIDDLHRLSAVQLCDTMRSLGKSSSPNSILTAKHLHELRAWIDREWASVCSDPFTATQGGERRAPNQTTFEQKVERILNRLKLHQSTKGNTKRGHYQYLNEKKNDPDWLPAYDEALVRFKPEMVTGKSAVKD
jgi:hypothetical protein